MTARLRLAIPKKIKAGMLACLGVTVLALLRIGWRNFLEQRIVKIFFLSLTSCCCVCAKNFCEQRMKLAWSALQMPSCEGRCCTEFPFRELQPKSSLTNLWQSCSRPRSCPTWQERDALALQARSRSHRDPIMRNGIIPCRSHHDRGIIPPDPIGRVGFTMGSHGISSRKSFRSWDR
jgi:hypothetical protein